MREHVQRDVVVESNWVLVPLIRGWSPAMLTHGFVILSVCLTVSAEKTEIPLRTPEQHKSSLFENSEE